MGWRWVAAASFGCFFTAVGCAAKPQTGMSTGADEALYDPPADWNVHTVASSSVQGEEPLNFILTEQSDVPIDDLVTAIQSSQWSQVGIGTGLIDDLTDNDCISAETATVESDGSDANVDQSLSLRVKGCVGIIESGENHARGYPQSSGAWFFTVAKESPCLIASWPPWWHCIDTDGYDTGRDEFLDTVQAAALQQGWELQCEIDPRPSGRGLSNVAYDGNVYACTLTE